MSARWRDSRKIQERVLVTGKLILETPALLGSGDVEGPADMPLLVDPLDGRALLTGSSLAGALRNYLRRYDEDLAETIFGGQMSSKPQTSGGQWQDNLSPAALNDSEIQGYRNSLLFVDDGLGDMDVAKVELRDGMAVEPCTGTAVDGDKYDLELLAAGSSFTISFELLVLQGDMREKLIKGLAQALQGLSKGEITLGGKKSRGFGRCKVTSWQVIRYELTSPEGMLAWLANDLTDCTRGSDIAGLLGVSNMEELIPDNFTLQASFTINGSLLCRSPGQIGLSPACSKESRRVAACLPDMAHLHSWRNENNYVPIVSGTSLAGTLRSRAVKIANTLGKDGYALTDSLFGYRRKNHKDETQPTASRLWVEEAVIQNPLMLVQSRIKIDRFTGGAYPKALFDQQPVFGKGDTSIEIKMSLDKPKDYEIGLLLLLLKDLWTGDLPLGGESAVGRGRLEGKEARLAHAGEQWLIEQSPGETVKVKKGDANKLEEFVQSLGRLRN